MRQRRDLLDVEVDQDVIDTRHGAPVQEVIEHVTLRPFAVELEPDLIVAVEMVLDPCRGVDEVAALNLLAAGFLGGDARTNRSGVVELHQGLFGPPTGRHDFNPMVGQPFE